MKIPAEAHVAVIDGERFILFRNGSDAGHPDLGSPSHPDLDPSNRSQGKMRHSITTNQEAGNDLDEAAHVAAAADWLNHAVLTHKIDDLIIGVDGKKFRKPHLDGYGMEVFGAQGPIEELAEAITKAGMPPEVEEHTRKELKRLEKLMFEHAKNLEFEKAARVRDQLALLREQAFGAAGHDSNVVPLTGTR